MLALTDLSPPSPLCSENIPAGSPENDPLSGTISASEMTTGAIRTQSQMRGFRVGAVSAEQAAMLPSPRSERTRCMRTLCRTSSMSNRTHPENRDPMSCPFACLVHVVTPD